MLPYLQPGLPSINSNCLQRQLSMHGFISRTNAFTWSQLSLMLIPNVRSNQRPIPQLAQAHLKSVWFTISSGSVNKGHTGGNNFLPSACRLLQSNRASCKGFPDCWNAKTAFSPTAFWGLLGPSWPFFLSVHMKMMHINIIYPS